MSKKSAVQEPPEAPLVETPLPPTPTPEQIAHAQLVFVEKMGHDPDLGFPYLAYLHDVEHPLAFFDPRHPSDLFEAFEAAKYPTGGKKPRSFRAGTMLFEAEQVRTVGIRFQDEEFEDEDDDEDTDETEADGPLIPFPPEGTLKTI